MNFFSIGWILGQVANRYRFRFFGNKLFFFLVTYFVLSAGFIVFSLTAYMVEETIVWVLGGWTLAVVYGEAKDFLVVIVVGIAGVIVSGTGVGLFSSMVLIITVGLSLGLILGVALGLLLGLVLGVTVGLSSSVGLGVALSLVWTFGVLRVCFWLPEFLWIGLLYLLTRQGKVYRKLRYLPLYFDEIIHLPLPFHIHYIIRGIL